MKNHKNSSYVNIVQVLKSTSLFNLDWCKANEPAFIDISNWDDAVDLYIQKYLHEGMICTPLFDKDYYCNNAKEAGLKISEEHCFEEYIVEQATWDISPHPLFDGKRYKDMYLSKISGDFLPYLMNPLVHYVQIGGTNNLNPSSYFRSEFYLSQVDSFESDTTPLEHYLMHGWKKKFKVNSIFDENAYLEKYNINTDGPIIIHYIKVGRNQNFWPCELFNPIVYQDNSGCIPGDELSHMLDFEDRHNVPLACDLIDVEYYTETYPDWKQYGIDILSHYLIIGWRNDHNPNPIFDVKYCLQQMRELRYSDEDPLSFYLRRGHDLGINPNPWFDTKFYVGLYPLAMQKGYNPISHYLQIAKDWPLIPSERFSPKFYVSQHPVLETIKCTPLEHYLRWGREANLQPLPQPAFREKYLSLEGYENEVKRLCANIGVIEEYDVSIVVPVYNNFDYTIKCVESILTERGKYKIQVIIADDCSTDRTRDFFSSLKEVTYVRNEENMGFLLSCNNAVKSVKAKYFVLLNNDTVVKKGWLKPLINTLKQDKTVGMVGSKLLYPNGTLQEGGGIVWSDGSAANFGRDGSPENVSCNYKRDADYISGAAIMLEKAFWDKLGGFDERYCPAYCEDSDLAFKVRAAGFRVVYQPASKVVHFEGVSSGRDLASGIKRYQVINTEKLKKKWNSTLGSHGGSGDLSDACYDRHTNKRLLWIDAELPMPDKDAGSVTAINYLEILTKLGYRITFIPTNLERPKKYLNMLSEIGVECLGRPEIESIDDYIASNIHRFDIAMLTRVFEGGKYFEAIRRLSYDCKIVFNTADLHYLREERQLAFIEDKVERETAFCKMLETKGREQFLLKHCDATILVSEAEKEMLDAEIPDVRANVIPLVMQMNKSSVDFEDRDGILFVGGFRHTPNVDSMLYFAEEIMPLIVKENPDIILYIVGSNVPSEIQMLESDNIKVIGFVEDLKEYFDKIRLSVAPLRYGAGVKGKVGTSLTYGVPVIGSPIALEGMGLEDGNHVIYARTSEEFAESVCEVFSNKSLWEKLSRNGYEFVEKEYSQEACKKHLLKLLSHINATPFDEVCNVCDGKDGYYINDTHGIDLECKSCTSTSAIRVLNNLLLSNDSSTVNLSTLDLVDKPKAIFSPLENQTLQNCKISNVYMFDNENSLELLQKKSVSNLDVFMVLDCIHIDEKELKIIENCRKYKNNLVFVIRNLDYLKQIDTLKYWKFYDLISKGFDRQYVYRNTGLEQQVSDVVVMYNWFEYE